MSMMLTFVVAGATGASAHDTSASCAKPAADSFLDQVLDYLNIFSSFVAPQEISCAVKGANVDVKMNRDWEMPIASARGNARTTDAPCVDGLAAGVFACDGIDLMGHVSMQEMRLGRQDVPVGVNDVWGWTDSQGRDYALLGTSEGTVFIDISTPTAPLPLGILPTASTLGLSTWRDIKVYEDHAFIVSEHTNHGVQVFDLTRLESHSRKKGHFRTYDMDAHYTEMGSSHNIAINEDTGFAYALGSEPFYTADFPYTVAVDGGDTAFNATGASFGDPLDQTGLAGPFFDTQSLACDEDLPLPDLTGTIALIDRGVCPFVEKVFNAQEAGANGVVILSTTDEYFTMGGGDERISIPAAYITNSDGAALRAELPATGRMFNNEPPPKCGDGLHMIDISKPTDPTYAGCESETGYVHDTQCVVYEGPAEGYVNEAGDFVSLQDPDEPREICFNSNGIDFGPGTRNYFSIVDVTDKTNPETIAITGYDGSVYSHQGWLTEDQDYFLFGDEGEEVELGEPTTTRVWDVSNLEDPKVVSTWRNTTDAIDHNIYTEGDLAYASNYEAGLRIYDVSDPTREDLHEVAFFDMYPEGDAATFDGGTWSNYAWFAQSNIVVASSVDRGLFVLRVHDDLLGDD